MSSLGWKLIRSFDKDFEVNGEPVRVRFVTMNCVHKQLYQVYVLHEGREVRFHIQKNAAGEFRIVGRGICPPQYVPLEAAFAEAILASPVG
ncbi:hypothetical protein [Chitinophaga rhizosphaerae]|uniref:hypothetical protein n=1 Tax=Chitinophaga rhizosphaerae TaxID=1864947 RepID=UPI000F7FEFE2|nr:hypothetical protein [Chitinophaga rhizosphaerae]